MSGFWSPAIHGLQPYVPGEQAIGPRTLKLNTNENPWPPSPKAVAAMGACPNARLRLYPDPESVGLRQALAEPHGLDAGQVFVGNGSDEVLGHAFAALLRQARPILFPDITYSFYPVYCALYGIRFETLPLDEQFRIRLDDYVRPNGGIVIANPNAPTGIALGISALRALLDANRDSVVLVDEAYADFGAQSAVGLVREYPQLLVVQTFSKSRSLAGMRVGFAFGHAALIEGLNRVKASFNSYPLDLLAQAGAEASIRDKSYFNEMQSRVIACRQRLTRELQRLGFEVLPSEANFVFARHFKVAGQVLQQGLRERDILVRRFEAPRIQDFLRITVGTEEQCRQLVTALESLGVSA